MLQKIELNLTFETKRYRNIITPCCQSSNKDGKFVTYKQLPTIYGYCHSCGKTTLPPTRYKDDLGNEFTYNDTSKTMEPTTSQLYNNNVLQTYDKQDKFRNTLSHKVKTNIRYIDFRKVIICYENITENNLLKYLRNKYGNKKTDLVKKMYYIGTTKDLGTVFWNINRDTKAQKAKVSYYKPNGKRTKYFKVPYKNQDGYHSCLFGEHLLDITENKDKPVMLVESEKTAIVCAMHFTEYVWLAYGGITGLTNDKIRVLTNRKVVLIPDMSKKAVEIMTKKLVEFKTLGINARVWDITSGKTDKELKASGWYNCDLEDVLRSSKTN
ncbi:MAG: DUF6371 domain-containing protein [Winogradskyella arenosi]